MSSVQDEVMEDEAASVSDDVSSVGSRSPGHLHQDEVGSAQDEVEDDAASVTGESLSET